MNFTYDDVHRWNSQILAVHQQTGVPANVIKAIMWVESRGRLNARSPLTSSGYYFGLMQIGRFSAVPEYMKDVMWMCDNPYNQTFAGGTELVAKSNAIRSTQWDLVAGAYFGFGTDITGTTTAAYMNMFRQHVVNLVGTTPGGTDWIMPPTPTPGPTNTAVPVSFAVGSTVEVGDDRINIRNGPGLQHSSIGVLLPGIRATVLAGPTRADNYDWFQIRTTSGLTGWSAGQLMHQASGSPPGTVTPTRTPTRTPTPSGSGQFAVNDPVVVNVPLLNLRSAPSMSAQVLSVMPSGATGVVTGASLTSGGMLWTPVNMTGHGAGWAASRYLIKGVGSTATITPTPQPSATRTATVSSAGDETYRVTVPFLNLRANPTTSAAILTTLTEGTIVTFLGGVQNANGYSWFEVQGPAHRGWIASNYVTEIAPTNTPVPSATSTATRTRTPLATSTQVSASGDENYRVTVPFLNLRANPTTSAAILTTLTQGTLITFIGDVASANGYLWYEVQSPTHRGWIASNYVTEVPPTSTPTPTATPTRTATSIATATPTATTTRTSSSEIRAGDTVSVTAGLLNLRSAPGTNSSILRTIPFGTTGTVMDGPEAATSLIWFQISTPFGAGWAASAYLERSSVGIAAFVQDSPGLTVTETPASEPTATEEPTAPEPTATPEPGVPEPTSTPEPVEPGPTETVAEPSPTETIALPEPTATATPTATLMPDSDGDGVADHLDSCPGVANSGFDTDGDGIDDACDPTPLGEPTVPPVVEFPVNASAGADTSVSAASPDAVQPAAETFGLPVGGASGGVAYITFWVEGLGGSQITNATLYLPVVSGAGNVSIGVLPGSAIDESSLTYATAPGGGGATSVWAQAGSEIPVDLTGWISSDGPVTIVVSGGSDPAVILGSREGGWPAYLVITAAG